MKMKKAATTITRIVFGFVERVKSRRNELQDGYATVAIQGQPQLTAPLELGPRFIEAGVTTPTFTDRFVSGRISPTDEVVMEVTGLNGSSKVTAWGYAKYYRNAQADIARRSQYRVVRKNRFLGKLSRGTEIVFTGNLQELASYLRDSFKKSSSDPFAPNYVAGPTSAENHFEVKKFGDTEWKVCDDPRPFRTGPFYRLMHCDKAGKITQITHGTAHQINWQFPRTDRDSLNKKLSAGEFIFWERRDTYFPKGTSEWSECLDPRPLPMKEITSAAAIEEPNTSTGTMPKVIVAKPKQPRKEFSTTVDSFESLAGVVVLTK